MTSTELFSVLCRTDPLRFTISAPLAALTPPGCCWPSTCQWTWATSTTRTRRCTGPCWPATPPSSACCWTPMPTWTRRTLRFSTVNLKYVFLEKLHVELFGSESQRRRPEPTRDYLLCIFQGETPLDLAKQRKNVWMINHLQEARQAKGYDSPSYLKRLKMDKVCKLSKAVLNIYFFKNEL